MVEATSPVRVEAKGHVTVITIDRPARRNAVDHATLLALLDAQRNLDPATRVVVLTGTPPAFSAGADLTGVENEVFTNDLGRVLRGFTQLRAIVVAAIDGPALGAGTQLASVCDLRMATVGSRFGIPAARLGLAVDLWTIKKLEREFGTSATRGMLLAAETYSAESLLGAGVHRLGTVDEALAWATEIAALAPLTLTTHKRGLELPASVEGDAIYRSLFDQVWSSGDAEEGRTAFLEKRLPRFSGS